MRTTTKFDLVLFIASIVAGVAAWLLGLGLYNVFEETMPQPLLIGLEFLLLFLILCVTVMIVGAIKGSFEGYIFFLDETWKIILFLVGGGIAVFGLGVLFQYIYGLNSEKVVQGPSSYIFVIDDSGSMEVSDPNRLRYQAIEDVLNGMPEDFPYMIYSFSNGTEIVRDMAPVSEGIGEIPSYSSGGTYIKGALNQVLDDYENKVWTDAGRPKVILLTDGYASDIHFFSRIGRTLKRLSKAHISVSTVGLGQVDEELMQEIATATEGIFLQVEDAALLKDAMTNAAQQDYTQVRNLLSLRAPVEKEWLYALMRIAFLTLLGTAIGCLMLFASTKEDDALLITLTSAGKSLVGAMLMEFFVQGLGVSAKTMWLILWILIAVMISRVEEAFRPMRHTGESSTLRRPGSMGNTSNLGRY